MKLTEHFTEKQQVALRNFWGKPVQWNVDMAFYSTLKTGGRAAALTDVSDIEELRKLISWLAARNIPWRILGFGSNILVAETGFSGIFLRLKDTLAAITPAEPPAGETAVTAGAGCSLARLLGWCIRNSRAGLEFLAGIPGSVGGAVRMNAGAFGHCMEERLLSVTCMDHLGTLHETDAGSIRFDYRRMQPDASWGDNFMITGCRLRVEAGDSETIRKQCSDILHERRRKQPTEASAGSFFKNPAGDFAGRLIEAAGLKGYRRGGASISPKHANFIINDNQATPGDITGLMREVQEKVFLQSGILLEPEVHIIE